MNIRYYAGYCSYIYFIQPTGHDIILDLSLKQIKPVLLQTVCKISVYSTLCQTSVGQFLPWPAYDPTVVDTVFRYQQDGYYLPPPTQYFCTTSTSTEAWQLKVLSCSTRTVSFVNYIIPIALIQRSNCNPFVYKSASQIQHSWHVYRAQQYRKYSSSNES